jgi:hypothetical protein
MVAGSRTSPTQASALMLTKCERGDYDFVTSCTDGRRTRRRHACRFVLGYSALAKGLRGSSAARVDNCLPARRNSHSFTKP